MGSRVVYAVDYSPPAAGWLRGRSENYQPAGRRYGPALRALDRQRRRFHPGHVGAVLDVVNAARSQQGLQVNVLVGLAGRIGVAVDARGAVNNSVHAGVRPAGVPADQVGGHGTQIQPAPSWSTAAAQSPRAVVQVEAVDVDADTHLGKLASGRGRGRLPRRRRSAATRSGCRPACRAGRCDRPCTAGRAISSRRRAGWPGPHRPARREGTRPGTSPRCR